MRNKERYAVIVTYVGGETTGAVVEAILNECISILENISEIGVPLPAFLLKLIEKLKKTVEDAGDQKAE